MSRYAFVPLALAAVLLAAACHNAAEPLPVPPPGSEAGTYVLRSVNGRAVPAVTDSSPTQFGVLEADTITLDGRGGVSRGLVIRRQYTAYPTDVVRQHYTAAYRLDGAGIEIGSFTPCPPNALCTQNETGMLDVRTLTLFQAKFYVKVYERVGP